MGNSLSWKMLQNLRDHAMAQGEEIAKVCSFDEPPIDPFAVIDGESGIYAEGADFGDAFDGCLEYVGNRFLLAFNTKYNVWPHQGDHHAKVRFTIGHELGHYFLDEHRNILKRGGPRYSCLTEFRVEPRMEQEADCFSAGLLMPSYLLSPHVNEEPNPTLRHIKDAARLFRVSMTSMMVRWVRLSDFPCGVFSVAQGGIQWGWVSDGFARIRAYRKRQGPLQSSDAKAFLQAAPGLARYRDSQGLGLLHHWVDTDHRDVSIQEFFAIIPYASHMLVFISASEDELPRRWDD